MSIEQQLTDKLKEIDPELDVREGTAIFELLVKPLVLVLEPLQTKIDSIKEFLSIANSDELPSDELDLLASNFFINRKQGNRSSVIVRVFLTNALETIITTGAVVTAENGQQFTNTDTFTFSQAEVQLNQEGELFFVDYTAFSLNETEEANIGKDELTGIDVDIPGFSGITNPNVASGGQRQETNSELVDRIKQSISLRNLITSRGISTILTETFAGLFEVRPIGFGDEEMHRDTTLGVHVGGRVDVYVVSSDGFVEAEALFNQSDIDGSLLNNKLHIAVQKTAVAGPSIIDVPIVKVDSVSKGTIQADGTFSVDTELIEGEDWNLVIQDISGLPPEHESSGQHFRFSRDEVLDIEIDKDHQGNDISVAYTHAPFVEAVQDFVDEDLQRVVCSDILVKIFVPAFIDMALIITPISGQEAPDYKTAIEDFIDRLPSPSVFELSDVVALIYDLGADQVDLPTQVTSTILKPDGTTATVVSENEINFEVIKDPSVPLTPAIIHTHAGTISITLTEKEGFPS
jgi:hypothetical protein